MKKTIRSFFKLRLFEKLLFYVNSGKKYGSWLTRITPNHTDYSSPAIRRVTRNGVKYSLDISNLVDWYIYFNFTDLPHERFLNAIQAHDTVIDVGANIGLISMRSAIRAKNGAVYSFEPYGKTYERLEYHRKLNDFRNIFTYNIGLGSTDEEVAFDTDFQGNPGMFRVNRHAAAETTRIKVMTLDKFVSENRLQQINAIKIDVEGYETEVLKGAGKVLSEFKPLLFVELDDNNLKDQGSSAKELIGLITSYGYAIRHAVTGEPLTTDSQLSHTHFDIICT